MADCIWNPKLAAKGIMQCTVCKYKYPKKYDKPPESLHRSCPKSPDYKASSAPRKKGPGDYLHDAILKWVGEGPTRECGCADRIVKMNKWGCAGCRDHLEEIIDWLVDEATKRDWWRYAVAVPGSRLFIRRMVIDAIRKAETGGEDDTDDQNQDHPSLSLSDSPLGGIYGPNPQQIIQPKSRLALPRKTLFGLNGCEWLNGIGKMFPGAAGTGMSRRRCCYQGGGGIGPTECIECANDVASSMLLEVSGYSSTGIDYGFCDNCSPTAFCNVFNQDYIIPAFDNTCQTSYGSSSDLCKCSDGIYVSVTFTLSLNDYGHGVYINIRCVVRYHSYYTVKLMDSQTNVMATSGGEIDCTDIDETFTSFTEVNTGFACVYDSKSYRLSSIT